MLDFLLFLQQKNNKKICKQKSVHQKFPQRKEEKEEKEAKRINKKKRIIFN